MPEKELTEAEIQEMDEWFELRRGFLQPFFNPESQKTLDPLLYWPIVIAVCRLKIDSITTRQQVSKISSTIRAAESDYLRSALTVCPKEVSFQVGQPVIYLHPTGQVFLGKVEEIRSSPKILAHQVCLISQDHVYRANNINYSPVVFYLDPNKKAIIPNPQLIEDKYSSIR